MADIYTKFLNAQFEWVSANYPHNVRNCYYDRKMDHSKVFKATGLKPKDFKRIEEGIKIKLNKLGAIKQEE